MKDTQLYSQILGIGKPWKVTDVQVSLADGEVKVTVDRGSGKLTCPKCGKACSGYDKRPRRWRHLDTCQLKTLLMAEVPRVECSEHGVVTVQVPWCGVRTPKTELECSGWHHAARSETWSVASGGAVTQANQCG